MMVLTCFNGKVPHCFEDFPMDCPQSQHRPHSAPRRSPSCGCDGSNSDPEIGHGSVAVDTMWDYHGGYI